MGKKTDKTISKKKGRSKRKGPRKFRTALRRICRQEGVHRMKHDVYPLILEHIKHEIKTHLRTAGYRAQYDNRQILQERDMIASLRANGVHVYTENK